VTATVYVLASASSGDATEIGSFLLCAVPPKVAKASTLSAAVAGIIVLNFASEKTALEALPNDETVSILKN